MTTPTPRNPRASLRRIPRAGKVALGATAAFAALTLAA